MRLYILADKDYYEKIPLLFDEDILRKARIILNSSSNIKRIISSYSQSYKEDMICFVLTDVLSLKNHLFKQLKRHVMNSIFVLFGDDSKDYMNIDHKYISICDDEDIRFAHDYIGKIILDFRKEKITFSHYRRTSNFSLILISSILGIMSLLLGFLFNDSFEKHNKNSFFIELSVGILIASFLITILSTFLLLLERKKKVRMIVFWMSILID